MPNKNIDLRSSLKKLFGFSEFRENQEEIINALLNNQDVFASMPTGGGKSLCYQLPAYLLEGTSIVISPLIALMKDQVDSAKAIGIKAEYINSTMRSQEIQEVYELLYSGNIDLLYVAPERFASAGFLDVIKSIKITFFAVDEAHCISEWGHDFRPDYLFLSKVKNVFKNIPVAAFTATATKKVQTDIIGKLLLHNPFIVRASFDRKNLYYQVELKDDVNSQILNCIKKRKNESGIVYRTTRKNVESTWTFLKKNGVKVHPYHAGLDSETRKKYQEEFNRDEVNVVVATIAFGMGIDKSNIRYVIHGDLPKNMEGYYQETGRAGRDGENADCILFYGRGDVPKIRYFITQISDEAERQNALDKLNELVNFVSVNVCRRKQVLAYFNEKYEKENCEMCDVCNGKVESIDSTMDAQVVMSAIARTGQRFGAGHVVDIVCGADTKKIRDLKHNEIKTYGAGKNKTKKHWRSIVDELIAQKCIAPSNDQYPVLALLEKGKELLLGKSVFYTLKKEETVEGKISHSDFEYNAELFDWLRTLRKQIADMENVPPFVVFSDKTLRDMCRILPVSSEEMLLVNGVGERKLKEYGEQFIKAIKSFLEDHPEIEKNMLTGVQPITKKIKRSSSSDVISDTVENTWNLLTEGYTYVQIAEKRDLASSTILQHMETLQKSGRKFNVETHIDTGKRKKIEILFNKLNSNRLKPVVDASNGDVSYEEARLVRIGLELQGKDGLV